MKLIRKYKQMRRDCWVDLECEKCGHKETIKDAYDDRNYWDNVIPNLKCEKCDNSSNDLGLEYYVATKYKDNEVV